MEELFGFGTTVSQLIFSYAQNCNGKTFFSSPMLLKWVYRIPKYILNQNQGIQLRKDIRMVHRFDLGSFFNSIINPCLTLLFAQALQTSIKTTLLRQNKQCWARQVFFKSAVRNSATEFQFP